MAEEQSGYKVTSSEGRGEGKAGRGKVKGSYNRSTRKATKTPVTGDKFDSKGKQFSGRGQRQSTSTATTTSGTDKRFPQRPKTNPTYGSGGTPDTSKVRSTIEARNTSLGRNTRYVGGRPDTTTRMDSGGSSRGGAAIDPATRKQAIDNIKSAIRVITSLKGGISTTAAGTILNDIWNNPLGDATLEAHQNKEESPKRENPSLESGEVGF